MLVAEHKRGARESRDDPDSKDCRSRDAAVIRSARGPGRIRHTGGLHQPHHRRIVGCQRDRARDDASRNNGRIWRYGARNGNGSARARSHDERPGYHQRHHRHRLRERRSDSAHRRRRRSGYDGCFARIDPRDIAERARCRRHAANGHAMERSRRIRRAHLGCLGARVRDRDRSGARRRVSLVSSRPQQCRRGIASPDGLG